MTRGAGIAGLLVLVVAIDVSPASAQIFSPGDLSRDHAELEGDDECGRCHESGRRTADDRCLRCHQDVGATLRARSGLHGREYRGQPCGGCHVEHVGRSAPLVRWPGGSARAFDHRLAGWPLAGGHADTRCRDCHDRRNRRGAPTYLGLSTGCASCHRDPHGGRMGAGCTGCHDQRAWDRVSVEDFDHSRSRFELRGRHAEVACAGCHGRPARWSGLDFDSCASCHRDPHAGRLDGPCKSCHVESGWDRVDRARSVHPGLSLRAGHARVACVRCHDDGLDQPPSHGDRCASCHRAVHEASFGRRCESCHRSIRWAPLPRVIGRRAHSRTPFPLTGAHQETDCSSCHDRELSRDRRYRQLEFDDCADCHADPHGAGLAGRSDRECAGCHDTRGFAPTTFGVEMHADASFPLEGLHAMVACSGCHGDRSPRLDFRVADRTCGDCHESPHGDQFAAEMAHGGCATCHQPAGWDRPQIDHSGWPLEGLHAVAPCESCHSPSDEDRQQGRGSSYRGLPRDCAGCHEDEHAGQFRLSDPVIGCDGCHTADGFGVDAFDHGAKTGFALEGRHAEAECASCHPTVSLRGGAEVVRWRLGYRRCSECHANPHAGGDR